MSCFTQISKLVENLKRAFQQQLDIIIWPCTHGWLPHVALCLSTKWMKTKTLSLRLPCTLSFLTEPGKNETSKAHLGTKFKEASTNAIRQALLKRISLGIQFSTCLISICVSTYRVYCCKLYCAVMFHYIESLYPFHLHHPVDSSTQFQSIISHNLKEKYY